MLRNFLSRTQRHVACQARQRRVLLSSGTSSTWRCLSSSGGGNDDNVSSNSTPADKEANLKDIYTNLFGDADDSASSPSPSSDHSSRHQEGKKKSGQKRRENVEGSSISSTNEVTDVPERLWSDSLEISDERWNTRLEFDDIPDWSPDFVSRISQERVKIHPGHGNTKEYANLRKKLHYRLIQKEVAALAEPKISSILALPTWQEKQDAVDALFESVEFQLREKEDILNGHPLFSKWVESALEGYLRGISKKEEASNVMDDSSLPDEPSGGGEESDGSTISYPTPEEDKDASPVFMDCYDPSDPSDQVVPKILSPLKPHGRDGPGRMVEEWELSAHDGTRRIMLRESTRKIARALEASPSSRVFVSGGKGVGKTAALAAIVASARKSGFIVLYLPDGNRLHRHGYYVRPNPKIEGLYDLPILSQEVCKELLASHEADLKGMDADEEVIKRHFTDLQLEELEYSGGKMPLTDLIKACDSNSSLAAMAYTVCVQCLMNQEEKPFLMVLDEFNCYYEPGHYFHMNYDANVRNAIPYEKINLFKPAMEAMALSISDDPDEPLISPVAMKKGGIVVGVSESCAIAKKVTDSLIAYAQRTETDSQFGIPLHVIEVPRFSELEVDHILANFESTGVGNLRCDRGETVMNQQGVAYLRMVSSCVGQELLDVCCY